MIMMQGAAALKLATRRIVGVRNPATAAAAGAGLRRGDLLISNSTTVRAFATAATTSSENYYALDSHPQLSEVPSLPLLGSTVPWYSNIPPFDFSKERENLMEMNKQHGYFYSIGMPGYGEGLHGTLYVLSDPREYIKVVRHEGNFPSGLIENLWPMHVGLKSTSIESDILPFFGRGEQWKRIRFFLQTDLLSPQAAAGYIPGVIQAAELASKGAPACVDDFNDYLHRCAFDMFSTVMLGELMHVADPNTPTDPINLEFVQSAVTFLTNDAHLLTSPMEAMMCLMLNIKSNKVKELEQAAADTTRIVGEKFQTFKAKYEAGELDELQQQSYLANAFKRLQEQQQDDKIDDPITEEELVGICWALLTASVDTTSGVLSWALTHIALNQDVQEKLYQELQDNLVTDHGKINPERITKRAAAPYLYAVLRESHRLTPAISQSITKQVSEEIEIHGQLIPANQKFIFNNYTLQMDPAYVDDPEEFRPERWFPDQVEARKGTPQELVDHPFFKDPFSQGARKCPGSRVASNEILCFLSQLLLDYKLSLPAEYTKYSDVPYTLKGTTTPIFPKVNLVPR